MRRPVHVGTLAKERDARYAGAADLVRALDDCADARSWTSTNADRWWELFRANGGAQLERANGVSGTPDTVAISLDDRVAASELRESIS